MNHLQKAVAKKRTFWVGAVVTSIVLILLLKSARSGDEVRFNGRTVSGWVYATSHYSTVETNQQLQAMMDNLGSNAIPPLLAILEAGEGKTASLYRKIALSSSPGWIKRFALGQLDKKIQPLTIALGLIPLAGSNATVAIPPLEVLAARTNDTMICWYAIRALAGIGTPAVESLLRLEQSSSPSIRPLVTVILKERVEHGRPPQRESAALALAEYDPRSYESVPTLLLMCNSRESAKRIAAIGALARLVPFHAAARDAVKSVAVENEDENIRQLAQRLINDFYATNSSRRPR